MTTVSKAYDDLIAEIERALPNHVELIDPYNPDQNDDLTFDSAFGVAFADGENTNRETCRLTQRRLFTVTLTRKIFKADKARNSYSVSERRSAEKQLFEDLKTLIDGIETNVSLNSSDEDGVAWCLYRSDSGLEPIRGVNLIMTRAIFEMEYFEDLTNRGDQ